MPSRGAGSLPRRAGKHGGHRLPNPLVRWPSPGYSTRNRSSGSGASTRRPRRARRRNRARRRRAESVSMRDRPRAGDRRRGPDPAEANTRSGTRTQSARSPRGPAQLGGARGACVQRAGDDGPAPNSPRSCLAAALVEAASTRSLLTACNLERITGTRVNI